LCGSIELKPDNAEMIRFQRYREANVRTAFDRQINLIKAREKIRAFPLQSVSTASYFKLDGSGIRVR
jgi:hypothetical protein